MILSHRLAFAQVQDLALSYTINANLKYANTPYFKHDVLILDDNSE